MPWDANWLSFLVLEEAEGWLRARCLRSEFHVASDYDSKAVLRPPLSPPHTAMGLPRTPCRLQMWQMNEV